MSTDREDTKALLTRFGVPFIEDATYVRVDAIGDEATVTGYSMFFMDFKFDAAGKFIQMGIWE